MMKSNAIKLRDAAAMIIGVDEADSLLWKAQDDAVQSFKLADLSLLELKQAIRQAVEAMGNMKQGRFQSATTRLTNALKEFEAAHVKAT